jgi:hypothetical protein
MDLAFLLGTAVEAAKRPAMNCDEVFAILTRGPFPSGDRHDRFVEAHLQLCLDCQRLAEALRPNDENRPEAVAPEDTVSLPGYWGGPLDAEIHPILSLAKTAGQPQPKRTKKTRQTQRQRLNLGHFAAAVLLGIVVAAVIRTLIVGSEFSPQTIPAGCLRHSIDPEYLLADRESGSSLDPLPRLANNCCNQCHKGGVSSIAMDSRAQAELHRNCAACHEWIRP